MLSLLLGFTIGCSRPHPVPPPAAAPSVTELHPEEVTKAYSEIEMLRRDPTPAHEAKLIELAAHPDFLLRIRAVRALGDPGFAGRPGAEEVIFRALDDSHWIVRATAAKAVGRAELDRSCRELVRRGEMEPNPKVKQIIDRAVARLRERSRC